MFSGKIEDYILFEDKEIIVCRKPAGIAVQNARIGAMDLESSLEWSSKVTSRPEVEMTIYEGTSAPAEPVLLENSVGRVSGEFVYIYPPGIPIVAPGEMLLPSLVHTIEEYQQMGLSVQGLKDPAGKTIQVVKRP